MWIDPPNTYTNSKRNITVWATLNTSSCGVRSRCLTLRPAITTASFSAAPRGSRLETGASVTTTSVVIAVIGRPPRAWASRVLARRLCRTRSCAR